MCRIGDACKQGMVSLFGYLPKGENLLTKTKTKRTSKKCINFAFLLFRNKATPGRCCICNAHYNNRLKNNV